MGKRNHTQLELFTAKNDKERLKLQLKKYVEQRDRLKELIEVSQQRLARRERLITRTEALLLAIEKTLKAG